MAVQNEDTRKSNSENIQYIHASIKTGETKALIKQVDGDFVEKVLLSDLPRVLPKNHPGIEASVIWDGDNEVVIAINPWNGIFLAEGKELGPRQGDDKESYPQATEKEKIGKNDRPYTVKNFYEVFEIVDDEEQDGAFKGSHPRFFLQDKYIQSKKYPGTAAYAGTEDSRWTVKLKNFGEAQGLYDKDIEWTGDGNVLPEIESRIKELKPRVRLGIENGFINTLFPLKSKKSNPDFDKTLEELGYAEEEKSAKKSTSDELDVDADFPKDATSAKTYTTKAKKVVKKQQEDDEEDL